MFSMELGFSDGFWICGGNFYLFFDCCFQLEQQSFFLIGVDGYEESGGPLWHKTGFLVDLILVFLRRGRFYVIVGVLLFNSCSGRLRVVF